MLFRSPLTCPTELEDTLKLPSDDAPTLSLLDSTLRRFISLCATYHGVLFRSSGFRRRFSSPPFLRTISTESLATGTCL